MSDQEIAAVRQSDAAGAGTVYQAADSTMGTFIGRPGSVSDPARVGVGARWTAGYVHAIAVLRRHSVTWLRLSLGVVYIWFGALKFTDSTPVAALVRNSVPFVTAPAWLVPALGGVEVLIGGCLLARLAPRVLLPLFAAHMVGTFSVLVVQPDVAFANRDPLLLTMTGEFVIKNLVLLAAGVLVCTWAPARGKPTVE